MSEAKREKNYFQHYRKKWEKIPQLKGWLSEAPSTNPEHAKAFCKYCQKKLVPHVTGLLKHASCRNHLKAAKEYVEKINAAVRRAQEKALSSSVSTAINAEDSDATEVSNQPSQLEDTDMGEILTMPADSKANNVNLEETKAPESTNENPSDEPLLIENVGDMETVTVIMDPISHTKKLKVVTNSGPLSTHVLDTIKGSPAIGLVVSLYRLKDSRWTVTDADGRCNDLLSIETVTAGRYKLQFALSQYYSIRNQDCFYPVVELTIDLADPNQKYTVPLLISPFSYSTYKA